jgi:hypothetical protein
MSATLSAPNATGASANPAARLCTPLPTHRLPLGVKRLNRIVPPTSETSAASENRTPVRAAREAVLYHERDARDAEHEPGDLAPGHPLAEQCRREHGGQHRVRADDERGKTGRNAVQADIAEAEIGGLIGDAEQRE